MDLIKRTWFYLAKPSTFEISPCSCGNFSIEWSEYEKHLWCGVCQKDFIPEHNGIFDGPIGIGVAILFGISFDRFNIETGKIERLNKNTMEYEEEKESPQEKAIDSLTDKKETYD